MVPGRAGECRCLEFPRPAAGKGADRYRWRGGAAELCGARGRCQPRHGVGTQPRGTAGGAGGCCLGERVMATEITVPTLGESVTTATVARWMKHEGDTVAADEPLVELETDKVTVEVSAPAAGVLTSIAAEEGSEVPVGALLAMLDAGTAPA